MYLVMMYGLMFGGTMLIFLDSLIPIAFPNIFMLWMRIIGLMLIWLGVGLCTIRIAQVGVAPFLTTPNPKKVILLHMREGGNAFFLNGKLRELEMISSKDKIFKDLGGGLRIAGHDVRITDEDVNHNIPKDFAMYLHKIREKYKVKDYKELDELYHQLQNLNMYEDAETQLNKIPLLKGIMDDPKKKQTLLEMPLEHIKSMKEILYDGNSREYKDYSKFYEGSPPYDLESFMGKTILHRMRQVGSYSSMGGVDWGKMAIPLFILMLGAAILISFLQGGGA